MDLLFLHFTSSSFVRHQSGDAGMVCGADFESSVTGFQFGCFGSFFNQMSLFQEVEMIDSIDGTSHRADIRLNIGLIL